jgi:hypothetical protein
MEGIRFDNTDAEDSGVGDRLTCHEIECMHPSQILLSFSPEVVLGTKVGHCIFVFVTALHKLGSHEARQWYLDQ